MILFALILLVATAKALEKPHFLSDEFIDLINSAQSTWTAGRNFHKDTQDRHVKQLLGVHRDNIKYKGLSKISNRKIHHLPENFDARQKWPKCKSIGMIRDQGSCGSCWAFGAVEAMSDRICIHSGQKLQTLVSAEDLTACCDDCGFGCDGGLIWPSWKYWQDNGISTGGLYNTTDGCKAYSIEPCEHFIEGRLKSCEEDVETPRCLSRCDANSNLDYYSSITFGLEPYQLDSEEDIMAEIYKNGPVEADFFVYEDFIQYKKGVYRHLFGEFLGGHAIKILGWGVENEAKYWLVANSWNSDWGDKGYFKILRGRNHCNIESDVVAGLPKL